MKKALLVLIFLIIFTGCEKTDIKDVTSSWGEVGYLEVITQKKNPEKPDLLVIEQDLILYDDKDRSKLSEFYRDTKTFRGDKDRFEERYGYYHIAGLVNFSTPDSNWAWTETDYVRDDRYKELQDAFTKCSEILELESKDDDELIYSTKVKGSELRSLHSYFEDLSDDEDVDLRFYISSSNKKYFIKRLYMKGLKDDSERLKESYVLNMNAETYVKIPKSLAIHMISNGYKIDRDNALTTLEEAEQKGYKPLK